MDYKEDWLFYGYEETVVHRLLLLLNDRAKWYGSFEILFYGIEFGKEPLDSAY